MRLLLVRHAPTGQTRRSAFPDATGADPDPPGPDLDGAGVRMAGDLRPHLPPADLVWSSHAARAVQTAVHAVRPPDEELSLLAEADFGRWAGRTMAEVDAADPEGLASWMRDPSAGPPDGERLADVAARAAQVLGRAARSHAEVVVAFTHGGFVRAALAHVTGAPPAAAWAFGIAPASVTVLEPDDRGEAWQVRAMGWQPSVMGVAGPVRRADAVPQGEERAGHG